MGYRSDVTYVVTFACPEPEKAYAQFIHFYEWVTKHHKIEAESPTVTTTTNVIAVWVMASSIGTWTR
jgi:hypothetical protein